MNVWKNNWNCPYLRASYSTFSTMLLKALLRKKLPFCSPHHISDTPLHPALQHLLVLPGFSWPRHLVSSFQCLPGKNSLCNCWRRFCGLREVKRWWISSSIRSQKQRILHLIDHNAATSGWNHLSHPPTCNRLPHRAHKPWDKLSREHGNEKFSQMRSWLQIEKSMIFLHEFVDETDGLRQFISCCAPCTGDWM